MESSDEEHVRDECLRSNENVTSSNDPYMLDPIGDPYGDNGSSDNDSDTHSHIRTHAHTH